MRPPRRFLLSRYGIIFLLLAVFSGAALAQSPNPSDHSAQVAPETQAQFPPKWSEALRALAGKIASTAGPSHRISLELKNISSLDSSTATRIRQALDSELAGKGLKAGVGGISVRVTLSEGTEGYVWVAEIQRGDVLQILAVNLSRVTDSDKSLHTAPILQKRTFWQQPEPFLDFSERPMRTIPITVRSVLERDRVVNYQGSSAQWGRFIDVWPILRSSGSRDDRGRFVTHADGTFGVFVATTDCINPPFLTCVDSPGREWPVGDGWSSQYAPGRNYFTGLSADEVGTEAEKHPFFALSRLEYDHGSDWIQTELDGKARLYKSWGKVVASFSTWGDDIASVKPGCGGTWHALVTGTGDWTQADYVQLYEIQDDQPIPIGQRLEFSGPILAMWSADDKKSARVVSKNLQTGMYEASIISVSCSD